MTQTRAAWAADKIELRPIGDLYPDARNARRHSSDQIGQLRASLREFGWTTPALIREDGTLVAGHGRLMAAQAEVAAGNNDFKRIPCIVVPDWWTDEQTRAYALADNQLALNADWDNDMLKNELADLVGLADVGVDIGIIGFDPSELSKILYEDEAKPTLSGPGQQACPKCGYQR